MDPLTPEPLQYPVSFVAAFGQHELRVVRHRRGSRGPGQRR
jgi:hypothetical protein